MSYLTALLVERDQLRADLAEREAENADLRAVIEAVNRLADEWDANSRARGDHGIPDSPSHAASALRAVLPNKGDER